MGRHSSFKILPRRDECGAECEGFLGKPLSTLNSHLVDRQRRSPLQPPFAESFAGRGSTSNRPWFAWVELA